MQRKRKYTIIRIACLSNRWTFTVRYFAGLLLGCAVNILQRALTESVAVVDDQKTQKTHYRQTPCTVQAQVLETSSMRKIREGNVP